MRRNRRKKEIKRRLDFLSRWKANQYYFYSEDAIELEGYPLLNQEGRYTREQVQRIIAYERDRHIDVIPCLELFGHQHNLFRIERYWRPVRRQSRWQSGGLR